jgi:hypothetical protein
MYGGPLFVSRRCSDAGSDETNTVTTLSLLLLWLLNGWLVLAYISADHLIVLLLLSVLIWLASNAPFEQRPRQILIGGLGLCDLIATSSRHHRTYPVAGPSVLQRIL